MYNYIVTSPGQGVQKPGMLDPWLTLSTARDRIAIWSDAVKFDLVTASRDENSLRDTAVAQPVIIAAALLSLSVLREKVDISGDGTLFAGHSVGELAAGVGAGYLSEEAALTLAGVRGGAMSSACALAATGMAAVMPTKRGGASDDEIVAKTHEHGLSTANRNGCNQFVVAGPSTLSNILPTRHLRACAS
ncbi:malonyl CoA-acyl carrier protein transacylase [Mycobacteroides abscessus MAB_082312_2258]|nr:malonyl CoA-acyl carrier protein transacylase [Mycobacteroides abscessus MAB_082312_2258]